MHAARLGVVGASAGAPGKQRLFSVPMAQTDRESLTKRNEIWGRIEPSVTVRRAWVKRHRTGGVANAVAKGGRVAACVIA